MASKTEPKATTKRAGQVLQLRRSDLQWNYASHKPLVKLTASRFPKGNEVTVTMVDTNQLLPPASPHDKTGTLTAGQRLCSGVEEWEIELPSKVRGGHKNTVVFDDLSICFCYLTNRVLQVHHPHFWSREALSTMQRFDDKSNVDSEHGHYGRPALANVDGKLYPIIVNGAYVLWGSLAQDLKVSSRITKNPGLPEFAVLDVDCDPTTLGFLPKAFDDYLLLSRDQYEKVFNGAQVVRKTSRRPAYVEDILSASANAQPDRNNAAEPMSSIGKRSKRTSRMMNVADSADDDEEYFPHTRRKASGSSYGPLAANLQLDATEAPTSSAAPMQPFFQAVTSSSTLQTPPTSSQTPLSNQLKASEVHAITAQLAKYVPPPVDYLESAPTQESLARLEERYTDIKSMQRRLLDIVAKQMYRPYQTSLDDLRAEVELQEFDRKAA